MISTRLIDGRVDAANRPTLQEVTDVFEELYQGTATTPGFCETETLIPSKGLLQEIHNRCNGLVAIVTGRPRKDCNKFLELHGLSELFPVTVCMEDAPPKPDPKPLLLACERLGVEPKSCIMIGDTPDDIRAAISAGAVGYGVLTPEEDAKLTLNLINQSQSMYSSMIDCGASAIWRAGFQEILDLNLNPYTNKRLGLVSRLTKETKIRAQVVGLQLHLLAPCKSGIMQLFLSWVTLLGP